MAGEGLRLGSELVADFGEVAEVMLMGDTGSWGNGLSPTLLGLFCSVSLTLGSVVKYASILLPEGLA